MTNIQQEFGKCTLSLIGHFNLSGVSVHEDVCSFFVSNDNQDDVVLFNAQSVYDHVMGWAREEGVYNRFRMYGCEDAIIVAFNYFDVDPFQDFLEQNTKMRAISPSEFLELGNTVAQVDHVRAWKFHIQKFGEVPPSYIAGLLNLENDTRFNYADLLKEENESLDIWKHYYKQLETCSAA